MSVSSTIATRRGLALKIEQETENGELSIRLRLDGRQPCVLHWGLRAPGEDAWKVPPPAIWPKRSQPAGAAVQTPFNCENGYSDILIRLPERTGFSSLDFVLFYPEQHAWDNNQGRNYRIDLARGKGQAADLDDSIKKFLGDRKPLYQRRFEVKPDGCLTAALNREEGHFVLLLLSDIPGLALHWGIARYSSNEWFVPPASMRPPGTVLFEGHTAQTPFVFQDGVSQLRLEIPEAEAPIGVQFVLKAGEGNRWLRFRGGNFFVPIRMDYHQRSGVSSPELAAIVNEIVQAEMNRNSWTLMHRFNLCYDLLERVDNNRDGLGVLFVWLRYSALRQLTWQRNYNTKPRELSHAQDRLTQKLAERYGQAGENRPLVRLLLASVGPGGEGQRIRDAILEIMHRHHVKEVSGHFLEEWHQKLHNNTTPDDIVICEAYLEFLYSNGDRGRFYQKLEEGGVTRQRLESFERPIRSDPDFVPHLKEGLIHDFQEFLRVLRSVHAGTDLETAINNARGKLDGDTQGLLGRIWEHHQGKIPLLSQVDELCEARRRLHGRFNAGETSRELLYLDLGLEQALRLAIERNVHQITDRNVLVELIERLLENRLLTAEDAELSQCRRHWVRLKAQERFSPEWSLHAKSVVDRIARVLGGLIDRTYQLLQPKAELLGNAFHADAWVITLFSEEVVRGNSLDFALSMLLRNLEPILRETARLGHWQIVSRGKGQGKVEVVANLGELQGKRFDGPRIVVAERVRGDEDIPEGVTAVIAPDVTDIVSHVAVRARNAGLLFASCYDPETLNQLRAMSGRLIRLEVTPGGDVLVEEAVETEAGVSKTPQPVKARTRRPGYTKWVLAENEFTPELTGGKSLNLTRLAGKLPNWVHRPTSIALPFGICEKVLDSEVNREAAKHYHQLVAQAESAPERVLPELRQTVCKLTAPRELTAALCAQAKSAGLAWPKDEAGAWECITRVWASKWNERAFYSRRTQRLPHEDLLMGVLIQQVIEADYAFVLHSANPFTGRREEVYAEMVLGLGETLVGNYPGRALSAVVCKKSKAVTLLAYPSKSLALRGGGLIFRSDSNGEDLAGFAGAGLYDSILLPPPKQSLVDYSNERLVWEEPFRHEILERVAELAVIVEAALGGPQDIEGVLGKGNYYVVQTRPQVGLPHE